MTWKKIIGQNRVKKILQKAIIENRIPHAYCFWGSEGIGKDALALEFAKVVNCRNPKINNENEIEACDECHSCRQADNFQHPNIHYIFSLSTGDSKSTKTGDTVLDKMSDEQVDLIREQLKLKSENPYHKVTLQNANQIKIASIREIKRNLVLSSSQQGRKVIIISRADEMTTESANAFLKSLEEPSDNTTIIITTHKHETILPTILSRCQQIRCEPLSDPDITNALIEQFQIPEANARLVSVFAQGSFSRAVEFLDEDMKELREEVVEILRISLKKRIFRLDLMAKIELLAKQKDKKKNETFLALLLLWLRDVYSVAKGNDENIINIDQRDTIAKFANNFGNRPIDDAIITVESAVTQIKRNVQPTLVYLNMFLKLREHFF